MYDKIRTNGLLQCACFLLILVVGFSLGTDYFFSFNNLMTILTASTVIGLMALGATFVIASGGIDLSTAAVMALAGVITAYFCKNYGLHPALAMLMALGVGTCAGVLTGLLINITNAPSFIVTLGMYSIMRALAFIISGGVPVYGLPESVLNLAQMSLFGIPAIVWLFICCVLLCFYLISLTRFGTHTLFMGDNHTAAQALGLPVQKLRIRIFALAGALSGLAGFVFIARTNSGDPTAGQSYELIAITAVILGGANLFGGRASIIGTAMGVLALGILQNGLNLMAISTFYQILFVGLVLLGSAFLRHERPSR